MPIVFFFFFQAEDGIRDAQESRGLGDVYKRQPEPLEPYTREEKREDDVFKEHSAGIDFSKYEEIKVSMQPHNAPVELFSDCLLYTSDAADEEDSVDLGGRRIIKKKKKKN
eukprot:TRINITY_DN5899_c0_g1_i8.p1 TRINITY_DN5899_c0_g1~~TRINITY_DN5899_c0_g1_i8.p1  ORF type:complete len:111 (-),score=57.53 TRINITY_DN5899_c0_g1_i8:98-430(-)